MSKLFPIACLALLGAAGVPALAQQQAAQDPSAAPNPASQDTLSKSAPGASPPDANAATAPNRQRRRREDRR
jgi:hypothetical protein